ncbi:MAG TPA: hypothetical protein VGF74_01555 [Thermoleophilaceae bacterium]|jgi:hypothetical protein
MRVKRLGLVPITSLDPAVRRYRLARLEEVALETPPNGNGHRNGARPLRRVESPAGIRDRRAG